MKNNTFGFWLITLLSSIFLIPQTLEVHAQTCTPAPVGLISWFPGDSNTNDIRGGNNGTPSGGVTFPTGKVAQAFSFDGTGDVAYSTVNAGSAYTIGFWMRPTLSGVYQHIISNFANSANFGSLRFFNDRVEYLQGGAFQVVSAAGTVPLNTYTHIALTYNGSVNRLYINGSLVATSGVHTETFNNPLSLGFTNFNNYGESRFNGQIDEVEIFRRALSQAEIQEIINAGSAGKCKPTAIAAPSGQVAWLAGGGNALDISGNSNNGILLNGTTFTVGKVGQGFLFNPSNDHHIKINASPSLDAGATGSGLTFETWIRPSNTAAVQVLAEWSSNSGNSGIGAHFAISGMGIGLFSANFIDTVGGSHFIESSGAPLTDNVYQHVAATYDKTTGIARLFLNGVNVTTQNLGVFTPRTNSDLYFGKRISSNNFHYAGGMDELSVYNRALTATEIQSIFNAGIAGKLKETTTNGTTAAVGDVTVTYQSAATRRTQEVPLEESDLPELPMGLTSTGLFYDVATDAIPSGTVDLCFNLPSFNDAAQFGRLRVLHLEAGSWQARTTTSNFATRQLCAQVSSLSPFAIALAPPTAASVSIGGRVMTFDGRGIRNVRVTITDPAGETRTALSNSFGYYRFASVPVGETYIVSAFAKHYTFDNPTQVLYVAEEISDVNFMASLPTGANLKIKYY